MIAPDAPRRKLLLGAAGVLALGGAAGFRALAGAHGLETRMRAGLAFGTTVALTVAGPDAAALESGLTAGFHEMRAVEAAASLFRGDSALARLNRHGRLDRPDPHLVTLLRFALDLAVRTEGAFDPTVQPLWPLWSGAAARGARPSEAALAEAVARIGWRGIMVSDDALRLAPGMGVTLNALIQGYAADRVMAALQARGIADAFIDTGEFGAAGRHADGTPWRLGLADPRAPGRTTEVIAPFSGFAATSGDAHTSFSDDHADHHIFDPRTGRSPKGLASVTVTAPTGLLADGLSTACMVLGRAAGTALVATYPGCAMRFVAKG